MKQYLSIINDPRAHTQERLSALKAVSQEHVQERHRTGEVNNHIHTIYSFSPYTPSMAALQAKTAGLEAAGSVDHDSLAAAEEMIGACAELGLGGCTGFEIRVSFKVGTGGPFRERKINNPDSEGLVYMTIQGVPKPAIPLVHTFLKPIREERLMRTQQMAESANSVLAEAGLGLIDFQHDIVDQSKYAEGGGITERHLLAAVAHKLIQKYGKGSALCEGLSTQLNVKPSAKLEEALADPSNPHYLFDLLGLLKSSFLSRIFIQPGEKECIPAKHVTDFANSIGAIPAYAYLGDVAESITGDKKAEQFEDAYLDALFEELSGLGYRAITYMPPRNTLEQLRRVQQLCTAWGFMEISGVDINSSRQSFNCPEVLHHEFHHLVDTTWALITHERLASLDPAFGIFSPENPLKSYPLANRLSMYGAWGRKLDLRHPEDSAGIIAKKLQQGNLI